MKFIFALVCAFALTWMVCIFMPFISTVGIHTSVMYVNGSMIVCLVFLAVSLRVAYGK
jgi:hypothetical protein